MNAERHRREHQPPEGPEQPPAARLSGSTPSPNPPSSIEAPITDDHRREVPEVERHDPAADQHHARPGPGPRHPPREQRLEREHDAGLQHREERQGDPGRVGVVHHGVVEADHRHRVGAGPHQRHAVPPRPRPARASLDACRPAARRATRSRAGARWPTRRGSSRSRPTCRSVPMLTRSTRPPSSSPPTTDHQPRRSHSQRVAGATAQTTHVGREEPGRHQRHLGCRAQRAARDPRRVRDRCRDEPDERAAGPRARGGDAGARAATRHTTRRGARAERQESALA